MDIRELRSAIRGSYSERLSDHGVERVRPLPANRWILSSALQKSIRRGDTEIGLRAALGLLEADPRTLWRRLMSIGFEDVGLGGLEVASAVPALLEAATWRKAVGEARIANWIAEQLCAAPKSRSADDVLVALQYHPGLEDLMGRLAEVETSQLLDTIANQSIDIVERCATAWYALGTPRLREANIIQRNGCQGIWSALADLGVPETLIASSELACRRTNNPLALFVCVLSIDRPKGSVETPSFYQSELIDGIPAYTLDGFTRSGKAAIRSWRAQSETLGQYPLRSIQLALFFIEGALVTPAHTWSETTRLRQLAVEAGVGGNRLTQAQTSQLMKAVENELPTLLGHRRRALAMEENCSPIDLFSGTAR